MNKLILEQMDKNKLNNHKFEKIAPVTAVLGNNDKLNLNKTEIINAENFKIGIKENSAIAKLGMVKLKVILKAFLIATNTFDL